MSDTDLKFFQSGFLQSVHHHSEHFCVCLDGIDTDQLSTKLGVLFQPSLITGMVDKSIAGIAQADWKIFCLKKRCNGSGNGRRDIRA